MRESNLRQRVLRAKARIYIENDDEFINLFGQELEVVQNLDASIRNNTMYNVMERVLQESKRILKESKEESRAFSDENGRSLNLEDRLEISKEEKDTLSIVVPDDIMYAGITDLKEYTITADSNKLKFYWFRYGIWQRRDYVIRPGNQFLTLAFKRFASEADIVKEINEQIDYEAQRYGNITSYGGNLGGRRSRNPNVRGGYTGKKRRRGVAGYTVTPNEE